MIVRRFLRRSSTGRHESFYLLKVVNPGSFMVSPAHVEPMYQRGVQATTEELRLQADPSPDAAAAQGVQSMKAWREAFGLMRPTLVAWVWVGCFVLAAWAYCGCRFRTRMCGSSGFRWCLHARCWLSSSGFAVGSSRAS